MITKNIFKKSQGNVVSIILIILLVLVVILILWKVIFPMAQGTKKETQVRQELSKTTMGVNDVIGNIANPENSQLEISITRGPGEMNLENTTKTVYKNQKIPEVDFISAIDISGSMGEQGGDGYDYLSCISKTASPGIVDDGINDCCAKNNGCATAADCSHCYKGDFVNGKCYMKYFFPYCCYQHENCSNEASCNFCADITKSYGSWYNKNGYNIYVGGDGTRHWSQCTIHDFDTGITGYPNIGNVGIWDPCNYITTYPGGTTPIQDRDCTYVCKGNLTLIPIDQGYISTCYAIPGKGCCNTTAQYGHDCTSQAGCEACMNGYWNISTGTCIFRNYMKEYCRGKDCIHNQSDCMTNNQTLNGTTDTGEHPGDPYLNGDFYQDFECELKDWPIVPPYPDTEFPCIRNKDMCENQCEGTYYLKTKLNFTITAHTSTDGFIDKVITDTNNSIGLVTYSKGFYAQKPIKNKNILKNTIDSLTPDASEESTNVCQALNQSIQLLNDSSIPSTTQAKIIILLTDGLLNTYCNGSKVVYEKGSTDPKTNPNQILANNEAIAMAGNAKTQGIKVYTVGLGKVGYPLSIDEDTLKAIALAGNGTYTYADVTQLKAAYSQIVDETTTEIVAYYTSVQIWNNIRFVTSNDTTSFTYDLPKNTDIILPLETKSYPINTGGIRNINKIDVYIVAHTEDEKEISNLVATWTPNSGNGDTSDTSNE